MDYINLKKCKGKASDYSLKAGESSSLLNVCILLLIIGRLYVCFQNHIDVFTDYHRFMIL